MLIFIVVSATRAQSRQNQKFEIDLDHIRSLLKIPGMAVAISKGDSIIYEKGLGYADIQNNVKVSSSTTFRIASVTKTFTSTIIMQLVEQGKLELDTPITEFGLDFGNPSITVRHLLTHTSEGEPGTHFQYNGFRFGKLGVIIEKAARKPFYQLIMENILQPAQLYNSAPGMPLFTYFAYVQAHKEMQPFFEKAFTNLAKPYELNQQGEIAETKYLDEFGAFGGLTSNVHDLLKYSAAIDQYKFISQQTQKVIFTPNRTKNGHPTPYGLGWFVQNYKGINFYWHYGQTQGESALFVKVPSRHLTLVALTNIDKLSTPFPLGDGDLFTSPLGQAFYKYFINQDKNLKNLDYRLPPKELIKNITQRGSSTFKEFYNKEIITQASLYAVSGQTTMVNKLYDLYAHLNFTNSSPLPQTPVMAELKNVGINKEEVASFSLTKPTEINVYGVGENCSVDFTSWCDYGWIEDANGKVVWQMPSQPAVRAGGAIKNQRVVAIITLPAGAYKLKYKSDSGHGYNNWDSAPPDNFFWGITLFKK
ncbi:serine hydrolase domain-containing protein [Adhaeribacter arboris]|uniref:serine hydrolase domain-containing protein n=1 Tax=Adhaeribacter arboris TaxID=2072846 RepID=UPI001304BAD7|nr:serine hydrolase domain-containing protein [Adhaeribacter arboris]